MRKKNLILIFGFLMYSCSSLKLRNNSLKYFKENNVEIDKVKFNQILSTNKFLVIQGDSTNYKKLILREKRGKITNRASLELLLEKVINRELDTTKPIVIIYYPGKDRCNSNDSSKTESRKNWFKNLEEGIYKIAKTKPIYIYKDKDGLKKYDGILTWHKDPESIVEKLFFKHHYPCSSFVVISKDGNYVSYFGEFSKNYLWESTKLIY